MKKYIVMLTIAAAMTACSDFTEIIPKGKVIPTTTEDYREMTIDVANSSTGFPIANVSCDDVFSTDQNGVSATSKAYFWLEDFYKVNENDDAWNKTYAHIYVMNVVIGNVMASTEGTTSEKQAILTEAKVWRAYYYWYLQSLYAKDYNEATAATDLSVPLSLTPDLEAKLPRATVREVTDQIWADLDEAEKILPDQATNAFRPTKGAVYALKARILFYEHKYNEAAEQARLALSVNNSLYDMRTWTFKKSSKPSAGINGREIHNYKSPEKLWYMSNSFSSLITSFCISDDLKELYDEGDLRFKFYFSNLTRTGGPWEDGRYRYLQNLDYSFSVPEMMLIEAEALARNNDSKALDIINKLRIKRIDTEHYKPLTANKETSLLDIVLKERRRELCLNSLRWLDMKRLAAEGIYKTVLKREFNGVTYKLEPNSKLYVLPIPLQVLSLNKNIIPNNRK
ncbi:SusD family protein [Hallella bergensis DSM 17361]|uniref:SusD family protein n=1 Tax=Hallella bergensis DSM 17361 TaxID=585502 RepID=D1PVW1_9BACT|nr:RagB/SusD family nutrient uptake outer membrane protein [Hallella bergensis]EFA44466.1 SusD family protein [Hallella bergensis DSM 17361]